MIEFFGFIPRDELIHLLLSLLVGLLAYFRFNQNWYLIVVALFFGLLIDVDHFFDYFAYFGITFSPEDFFNVCSYMKPAGKIYVLLHGWEYLLVFGLASFYLERKLKLKGLVFTVFFSYLFHLLWDNTSLNHQSMAYSLIYRALNDFDLKNFVIYP